MKCPPKHSLECSRHTSSHFNAWCICAELIAEKKLVNTNGQGED